jgi:hypothetical protein
MAGLALAALVVRRLRKGRRRPVSPAPIDPLAASGSPRDQLIAWSHTIRGVLSTRFGASWRAKTTEEIADDGSVAELIGPADFERLVHYLEEADRLKFAESDGAMTEPLFDDLARLVDALAAGASSRIKG